MDIVIRKRISFDFLGNEYKEGYIVFKAIAYEENQKYMDMAKGKDTVSSLDFIKQTLTDKFIEGKFPNAKGELEDLAADDIVKLDNDSIIECFQRIMGGKQDPKV